MFEKRYRKPKHRVLSTVLYVLGIIVLVGIDQLIKYWAVNFLKPTGSMNVIGEFLKFTYTENSGAAFSILQNQRWVLISLPVVLSVVFLCVLIFKPLKTALGNTSLMLIVAGGLGNLIDRISLKYVVDFIDFHTIGFAIFNFADMCVTIGAALLVIYIIIYEADSGRSKYNKQNAIFTRRRH